MTGSETRGAWTNYRRYLSLVFLIIFLAWIVAYAVNHWPDFKTLKDLSASEMAGILLVAFAAVWVRGLFTFLLVSPFGAKIGVAEAFFISLVSTVGNYALPMRGGIGLRAVYLKRRHLIGYKEFARISLARFGTIFFVDSILGLATVYLMWRYEGDLDKPILIVLAAAFFVSSFIQLSSCFRLEGAAGFPARQLKRASQLLQQKGLKIKLIPLALLNSIIRVIWITLCFRALSVDLSLLQGLLISSLIPLSMMVTLTPGNLGITEGLLIYVTGIYGISPSIAIMGSMLMRSSVILWSLLMIPFLRRFFRVIRSCEQ